MSERLDRLRDRANRYQEEPEVKLNIQSTRYAFSGILTNDTTYSLIIDGFLNTKVIDNLIAKLKLDREICAECEDNKDKNTLEVEYQETHPSKETKK